MVYHEICAGWQRPLISVGGSATRTKKKWARPKYNIGGNSCCTRPLLRRAHVAREGIEGGAPKVRKWGGWIPLDLINKELKEKGWLLCHGRELLYILFLNGSWEGHIDVKGPMDHIHPTPILEQWRIDFFPKEGAIRSALIWMILPLLLVEYWRKLVI